MTHPFKEFHEDAAIGNLIWRLKRRGELLADSQDGTQIHDLERSQDRDRKELKELKDAFATKETDDAQQQ